MMLDASRKNDKSAWLHLWLSWPGREVSAHPEYASLFAAPGDRVMCAAIGHNDNGILFPFIVRPLAQEKWAPPKQAGWDATSPYGYAGPFSWGCQDDDIEAFWLGLRKWASSVGLVSVFTRLSLFKSHLAVFKGTITESAPNVVRSLNLPPSVMWMDYEHKVRKNVKHAQREGVNIELDLKGSRLEDFLSIYRETMDRRSADSSYYFDAFFFRRLIAGLPGQFVFFHALYNGTVVSTELVLISVDHIYSFLGGTRADAFNLRPNDLLKHEIILWAQASGKKAYVLGGGYGGPDGIYRYKLSFAPNGTVPFYTGRIIFDHKAYDRLVAMRAAWEAEQGHEWKPRPEFFPMYRA
jgi:hypothetical protein